MAWVRSYTLAKLKQWITSLHTGVCQACMGLFVLDAGHGTDFITTHGLCSAQCTVSSAKCEHHAQFDYNIKMFNHSAAFIFTPEHFRVQFVSTKYNYTRSEAVLCWNRTMNFITAVQKYFLSSLVRLLVTQNARFTNTITEHVVSFSVYFFLSWHLKPL